MTAALRADADRSGWAMAHCRGRIASFKIPRRVIFVDEFPMTSSGKIQKAALREQALRQLGTPAGAS
jgi:acyl-CoA synthetase (AMP-forming)/AMP-acid ligase II